MHIVLTLNTKEMTNSLCFACDCSIYIYTTSHRDKCYEIKDEAGEGGVVESDQW